MSALLVSCNKDNGGGSSGNLIGTWKVVSVEELGKEAGTEVGDIWTFEKGGTLLYNGFPWGQYRYDASTKIIKVGGYTEMKVLSLSSKSMKLSYESDMIIVTFEKQ